MWARHCVDHEKSSARVYESEVDECLATTALLVSNRPVFPDPDPGEWRSGWSTLRQQNSDSPAEVEDGSFYPSRHRRKRVSSTLSGRPSWLLLLPQHNIRVHSGSPPGRQDAGEEHGRCK